MTSPRPSLAAVCAGHLKVSLTSFGGPAAQVALLAQLYRENGWLEEDDLKRELSICKLLPGPVGTQYALVLARNVLGRGGALLAGLSFVLPPLVLILLCSAAYVTLSGSSTARVFFHGMQGAAVYLIVDAIFKLRRGSVMRPPHVVIALVTAACVFVNPSSEIWAIVVSGLVGVATARGTLARWFPLCAVIGFAALLCARPALVWAAGSEGGELSPALASAFTAARTATDPQAALTLFIQCFKSTALVFGTGFASLAVLKHALVNDLGLLSNAQFLDAVALGQLTPGPVVMATTLMGLWAAGGLGAALATVGTFLPSFLNTLVLVPLVPARVWASDGAKRFISYSFPAVLGGLVAFVLLLAAPFMNYALRFVWGGDRTSDAWLGVQFLCGLLTAATLARALTRMPAWALIPLGGILTTALFAWRSA